MDTPRRADVVFPHSQRLGFSHHKQSENLHQGKVNIFFSRLLVAITVATSTELFVRSRGKHNVLSCRLRHISCYRPICWNGYCENDIKSFVKNSVTFWIRRINFNTGYYRIGQTFWRSPKSSLSLAVACFPWPALLLVCTPFPEDSTVVEVIYILHSGLVYASGVGNVLSKLWMVGENCIHSRPSLCAVQCYCSP